MTRESSGGDRARFEHLGLYDSTDEDAERRLALLRDLAALGATDDDLVASRDEFSLLAFQLVAVPGRERLTLDELADRAGVPQDRVLAVWQCAGFQRPSADARVFTEFDVELMRLADSAPRSSGMTRRSS